ncbi:MAG TPA: hypothetical protein VKE27_11400 [Candidatus Dormibacteraeota bacterium]|nr:hypothetical protein [Candidatus Dormibacteraeota bacterium]
MPSASFLSSNQQGRGGPQLVASPIYPLQPSLAGNTAGRLSLATLGVLIVALLAFAYWTRGHQL